MNTSLKPSFFSAVNKIDVEILDGTYTVGDSKWKRNGVNSPFSRLYFFESGKATLTTDTQDITMTPFNVYLVPNGLTFNYSCDDSYTKLYLHFNITMPDGYDLFKGCKKILCAPIEKDELSELIKCCDSKNAVHALRIKEAVLHYASAMLPKTGEKKIINKEYSPHVLKAMEYIKKHPSIQLSVKSISEHLFCAPTTLALHFKNEVGVNIGKYIDDIVFENAKGLLVKTDMPISAISEKFGFCDQFYFSRRFKEKFEFSPNKYRQSHLGDER